jgi:hypothetical protein
MIQTAKAKLNDTKLVYRRDRRQGSAEYVGRFPRICIGDLVKRKKYEHSLWWGHIGYPLVPKLSVLSSSHNFFNIR